MASAGSDAIFTPAGKRTRTGVPKELAVPPSPSSPCEPRPQAYTLPLVSSAYSVEFELAICATGPGRCTVAGHHCVSTSPLVLPKNEPQCLATDPVVAAVTAAADPAAAAAVVGGTDEAKTGPLEAAVKAMTVRTAPRADPTTRSPAGTPAAARRRGHSRPSTPLPHRSLLPTRPTSQLLPEGRTTRAARCGASHRAAAALSLGFHNLGSKATNS
jgi:hypothetical protein